MPTVVAELVAKLVADTSKFRSGMAQADASIKKTSGGMKDLVGGFGGMAKALAGGAALGAVGIAFKSVVDEMKQTQVVNAQTNAALRSTGAVAGVTAKEVQGLAQAIAEKSGLDDQAVQSASNLLLTFKNVRNEVGKGSAVFDRATKAAVDLSVAGFGDMSSTAKMLGKALNDPIAGIKAMTRAGVTFTASQTETIKALASSGQLLEAQKMILAEVESQVKGSAAAYGQTLSGQIGKAKEALLDLGVTVANTALPALSSLVAGATEAAAELKDLTGGGGGSGGSGAFRDIGEGLKTVNAAFNPVMKGLQTFRAGMALLRGDFSEFINQAKDFAGISLFEDMASWFSSGDIDTLFKNLKKNLKDGELGAKGAAMEFSHFGRSLEETIDATRAIINAQMGLSGALLNVESAQRSYSEAVKDHGAASLEARTAEQNLASDILAAGDAARDGAGGVQAQIDTLNFLKGTLDPGSPLRANIEAYIAQLMNIPGAVPTTITVNDQASPVIAALQGALNALSAGVTIPIVGEARGAAREVLTGGKS